MYLYKPCIQLPIIIRVYLAKLENNPKYYTWIFFQTYKHNIVQNVKEIAKFYIKTENVLIKCINIINILLLISAYYCSIP